MDRNRIDRDKYTDSVFASTLPAMDYLFAPVKLTEEERAGMRDELYLWFGRFVRRPAGELPARHLRWALIWASLKLAYQMAEFKGDIELRLPHDPNEIARIFGLEVEEPKGPQP